MIDRIPPLLSNCLVLFAIYYLLMPAPALGYFDLGTGTYMVQMFLGFGAAIWLSLRTSWIRVGRKKKAAEGTTQNTDLVATAGAPVGTEASQDDNPKNES